MTQNGSPVREAMGIVFQIVVWLKDGAVVTVINEVKLGNGMDIRGGIEVVKGAEQSVGRAVEIGKGFGPV